MIGGNSAIRWADLTLSLDTSAYADGDVLADRQELTQIFTPEHQTVVLQSLVVLDEDDQGIALDVVFLNEDVTIGTENAAVSVTDANARTIQGIVSVAATDFVDLANSQLAMPQFCPIVMSAEDATARSLWVAAISRGAGTYTASGIRLRAGFIL